MDVKAFDFNLFDQLHPIRIQCIQDINKVMMLFMRSRIIQHNQYVQHM